MLARQLARIFLPGAYLAACKKEAPPPKPEVQLATDLPAEAVDVISKDVARRGGPVAEHIPGLGLGATALAEAALTPPPPPAAADAGVALGKGQPADRGETANRPAPQR